MDFGTIKQRLNVKKYRDAKECLHDMFAVFQNCYIYNPPGYDVVSMAQKLEHFIRSKLKNLPFPEVEETFKKLQVKHVECIQRNTPEQQVLKGTLEITPINLTAAGTNSRGTTSVGQLSKLQSKENNISKHDGPEASEIQNQNLSQEQKFRRLEQQFNKLLARRDADVQRVNDMGFKLDILQKIVFKMPCEPTNEAPDSSIFATDCAKWQHYAKLRRICRLVLSLPQKKLNHMVQIIKRLEPENVGFDPDHICLGIYTLQKTTLKKVKRYLKLTENEIRQNCNSKPGANCSTASTSSPLGS